MHPPKSTACDYCRRSILQSSSTNALLQFVSPAIHQTIGTFQIPVSSDVSAVKVSQSFRDIVHEGEFKHPVECQLLLLQNVLQASPLTKFHHQARLGTVDARSDKSGLLAREQGRRAQNNA